MKIRLALFAFVLSALAVTQPVDAQTMPDFINPHRRDKNPGDLNQAYINTRIYKIKNFDPAYYTDGAVIKGNDTIKCKIYMHKHKWQDDAYLYIMTKMPSDTVYIYTPKDISGYIINGVSMRAYHSDKSGETNYFFIKLLQKGKLDLYERPEVPCDREFLYYFQKTDQPDFLFLAPYKKNYMYIQEKYKDGEMITRYNNQCEDNFRAAFVNYLSDCKAISNKIASKFYTMNDLETIVKEYNECKK